jgi:hypothetical protein
MILDLDVTISAKRDEIAQSIRSFPVAIKFTIWLYVMYTQVRSAFTVFLMAYSTFISIAFQGRISLTSPIRPAIFRLSATPHRVFMSAHFKALPFMLALHRTINVVVSFASKRLEYFAAYLTFAIHRISASLDSALIRTISLPFVIRRRMFFAAISTSNCFGPDVVFVRVVECTVSGAKRSAACLSRSLYYSAAFPTGEGFHSVSLSLYLYVVWAIAEIKQLSGATLAHLLIVPQEAL